MPCSHPLTEPTLVAEGIPTSGGTYALLLTCREQRFLNIGRLGILDVKAGIYVYIGSAFGPGGLHARISHHLRPAKRRHWHLDYLRSFARPLEIWFSDDPERREHLWASLISRSRGATLPLPGFGSTDCSCPAHLFFFSHTPSFNGFKCRLRHAAPDHGRLYRQTRTTPSL